MVTAPQYSQRRLPKRPPQLGEAGVFLTLDKSDDLMRAIKALLEKEVLVGIPAENAQRDPQDGDTINNAALGYIHEFGVPEKNIPARPHLVPGMQAYARRATERLKAAARAALEGRGPEIEKQLNAAGIEAVSSVRKEITDGALAPLSPKTIYARQHRNDKPKRFGTKPLIDFGDYLRHISYVIRKKAK